MAANYLSVKRGFIQPTLGKTVTRLFWLAASRDFASSFSSLAPCCRQGGVLWSLSFGGSYCNSESILLPANHQYECGSRLVKGCLRCLQGQIRTESGGAGWLGHLRDSGITSWTRGEQPCTRTLPVTWFCSQTVLLGFPVFSTESLTRKQQGCFKIFVKTVFIKPSHTSTSRNFL